MRTQYDTATRLDGFIATEGDPLDWLFLQMGPTMVELRCEVERRGGVGDV